MIFNHKSNLCFDHQIYLTVHSQSLSFVLLTMSKASCSAIPKYCYGLKFAIFCRDSSGILPFNSATRVSRVFKSKT